MSKYDALWKYIQESGRQRLTLSFDEIGEIAGVPIDHSFLRAKRELTGWGYEPGSISLKKQTAAFRRLELRSDRLRLCPCSLEEMEQMIREEADAELRTAYEEMRDGALRRPQDWVWYAIWRIEETDGTPVGDLCFKGLRPDGMVEIGYGVREEQRDRGFASEAVKTAVDWALKQPGVKRIEAETAPDNRASQRVLAKCGFAPTGETGEEGPRYAWAAS